jgi:hypothetical protein
MGVWNAALAVGDDAHKNVSSVTASLKLEARLIAEEPDVVASNVSERHGSINDSNSLGIVDHSDLVAARRKVRKRKAGWWLVYLKWP